MLKRILVLLLMVGVAWAFFPLTGSLTTSEVGPLAKRYLQEGPGDLGAANLVTSVVVTYRGLDTLGEVTVLFAAAAGVALVMGYRREESPGAGEAAGTGHPTGAHAGDGEHIGDTEAHPPSEILTTAAGLLVPLFLLFGVYIFSHGHLTPGGGFQGGVVIASAVLLALLGRTMKTVHHGLLSALEMLAGASYVAVGLLGLWLAAGFLDPRFLPSGEVGSLFSAGAIPIIYSLVGIKVGAELSGMIDVMRRRA